MVMQYPGPFDQARGRIYMLAENLERAHYVNELILQLLQDESECSVSIGAHPDSIVGVHYESQDQVEAIMALKIIAALNDIQGINA